MSVMRAILVKGEGRIEDLYIGETEKPIPKDDEVLVKVSKSTSTVLIQIVLRLI